MDLYHDVEVEDPYRWLESDVRESEEVATWVKDQNTITRAYLDSIPILPEIKQALTDAWNYPKHGQPFRRGNRWFQARNNGLQNHSVIYTGDAPTNIKEILLDPNSFSDDGTRSLAMYSPSPEGTYLTWGISDGGSDWSVWYAKNLVTGAMLPEVMHEIKNISPKWLPDESGY